MRSKGETPTPVSADLPVADLLANPRWTCRADPFPHVVATDVFAASFYRRLEVAYQSLLSRGLTERPSVARFARGYGAYGAHVFDLSRREAGPLDVFISRSFLDLVAEVVGVVPSGDVAGGLHHREPGGRDAVRAGYNVVYVADRRRADGINEADPAGCDYRTGAGAPAETPPHAIVRAAAVLFSLSNPGWEPGAGGEMGLYRSRDDDVRTPARVIPPIDNSLVAFACTPASFHAFTANRVPLNSVILWLHQEKAAAVDRWGAHRFEGWT
jgi:hypothetical protein